MALIGFGLTACATTPSALGPRVVWVSGERAYVASRDSTALAPGDRVSFLRRGKTVATGAVASTERGEMAMVRLSSGSLASEKDLGSVLVVAERSALRPASLLRLGFPSARRFTPFFACARVWVRPWLEGAYRAPDTLPDRTLRFVRDSAIPIQTPLPDTLHVRFYDEAADEEIALERGHLDAAIFWPGDLSGHMRAHPRLGDPLFGVRSRGVVVLDGARYADHELMHWWKRLFEPLNRDLFRGDLLRMLESLDSTGVSASDPLAAPWSFVVDDACPGRAALQRYVDRLTPTRSGWLVRLSYLDRPPSRTPEQSASQTTRWTIPLFAIRCPVVCAPELRPYLTALGPNALVDLLECAGANER